MKYTNKRQLSYGLISSLLLIIGIGFYQYMNMSSDSFYEYGFPFVFYEYAVILSRGRIMWLGVIGNILFTGILGYVIGVIISFVTKDNHNLK